jgi:hypothetical protein
MHYFVRGLAFLLGLLAVIGPIDLALAVAGVEPNQPIHFSWVAPFALGGLVAALGYMAIAIAPRRIARGSQALRFAVATLMLIPCSIAFYLLVVTHANEIIALALLFIGGTAIQVAACFKPAWLIRETCE